MAAYSEAILTLRILYAAQEERPELKHKIHLLLTP